MLVLDEGLLGVGRRDAPVLFDVRLHLGELVALGVHEDLLLEQILEARGKRLDHGRRLVRIHCLGVVGREASRLSDDIIFRAPASRICKALCRPLISTSTVKYAVLEIAL